MKDLDKNLLRPAQIEELEGERENLEAVIHGGRTIDGQLPGYRGAGSGEARRKLRSIEKMLADQAPERLTAVEKDRLYNVEKELRDKITYGMLSKEEMRKAPPTAVDRHRRWEATNKKDIFRWKNVKVQLSAADGEPASSRDRDAANLEQFRPEGVNQGIRTDNFIQGVHAMSPLAKENWPLGEPKCDTAVAQNKRVMSESQKEKLRVNAQKARDTKKKKQEELRVPPVVLATKVVGFKPAGE